MCVLLVSAATLPETAFYQPQKVFRRRVKTGNDHNMHPRLYITSPYGPAETVGGDSFEHFNIYGRMVCVQMLMHTWEFWEDGKINEAQEQEEEDNEDIPLGEETDMKVLTAMENDGNGEVTPFRAALSQLLRGARR